MAQRETTPHTKHIERSRGEPSRGEPRRGEPSHVPHAPGSGKSAGLGLVGGGGRAGFDDLPHERRIPDGGSAVNHPRHDERPGEAFRELLKERARGPGQLGHLDPETCERAMAGILSGEATPAQAASFLLVGRAAGDSPPEIAAYARAASRFVREIEAGEDTVTVAGGFDGKLRTMNVGAASSLVAAAAGAKVLIVGGERTPPKEGRTVFDALRSLGADAPQPLDEAARSLERHGFAATTSEHYLPELHSLLGLRWEMARRTSLNVIEKMVSPIPSSARMVGITHGSFLKSVPEVLVEFGVSRALVFQAVEGSDEAPLDGRSSLVLVRDGKVEEFDVHPESLGLGKSGRPDIPWQSEEDEAKVLMAALDGEDGAVRNLVIYNAALRIWMSGENSAPLEEGVEKARNALGSGAAMRHIENLGHG